MKLFSNNCLYILNLKAGYGYIFFYCLLNYLSVMRARFKVGLVCKILIVAISELTKTISDQATMFFCAGGCIASSCNVKYVCFNLLKLLFIASSTNSDNCYQSMTTKITNFLYDIQYLLFEIVLRKITLPTKSKRLSSCSSSSANNSFNLQYQ